jgi:flavin reductase (DIM6/NTAB) family NADH-FMN oxidoreductase RutF
MTVAWGGICCSQPPCVTVSLRKATYSYGNIMERKAYTVSIPSVRYMREADYVGIYSGHHEDKFAETGLTATRSEVVDAPYVQQFPIVLECRLLQAVELGLHTLFLGEIVDVKADEEVLGENGMPDIARLAPLVFDPGQRGYYQLGGLLGKAFEVGRKEG